MSKKSSRMHTCSYCSNVALYQCFACDEHMCEEHVYVRCAHCGGTSCSALCDEGMYGLGGWDTYCCTKRFENRSQDQWHASTHKQEEETEARTREEHKRQLKIIETEEAFLVKQKQFREQRSIDAATRDTHGNPLVVAHTHSH